MKNKLNDLDLQILRLLQQDADMPQKQIAAILGKALATICFHIKKMKRMNVIQGSRIQLNAAALGIDAIGLIYLNLDRQSGTTREMLASELSKIKGVVSCMSITGQASLIITLAARNLKSFDRIKDAIASIPHVTVLNTDMKVEMLISERGLDF